MSTTPEAKKYEVRVNGYEIMATIRKDLAIKECNKAAQAVMYGMGAAKVELRELNTENAMALPRTIYFWSVCEGKKFKVVC